MRVAAQFGDLTVDGIRLLNGVRTDPLGTREDAVMMRIALAGATRKILSARLPQSGPRHSSRSPDPDPGQRPLPRQRFPPRFLRGARRPLDGLPITRRLVRSPSDRAALEESEESRHPPALFPGLHRLDRGSPHNPHPFRRLTRRTYIPSRRVPFHQTARRLSARVII